MFYRSTARRLSFAQGKTGGADPDRTGDPLLAKQVLSQLSYSPENFRRKFSFHSLFFHSQDNRSLKRENGK